MAERLNQEVGKWCDRVDTDSAGPVERHLKPSQPPGAMTTVMMTVVVTTATMMEEKETRPAQAPDSLHAHPPSHTRSQTLQPEPVSPEPLNLRGTG